MPQTRKAGAVPALHPVQPSRIGGLTREADFWGGSIVILLPRTVEYPRRQITLDRESRRTVPATGGTHRVHRNPFARLDIGNAFNPLIGIGIV